jgi:hypothetical protein
VESQQFLTHLPGMTTRRATHRYPRRGERIAPRTLREFLLDPIPKRLLVRAEGWEGRDPRLCALDETAWEHFPEDALVELSRLVIDHVAAHHVRKVFQQRHFPRPPDGLRLEDLRLESRTRRCLLREGYEEDPQRLGDRTIGEILSLQAFGPRCLVDLLSALESWGARAAGGRAAAASLDQSLTEAARRLAALAEARLIRREDPRFAALIEAVDAEAPTARELADRLLGRTTDPPDPSYAAAQVEQLAAAVRQMAELTIEQELIGIFGATPYARNREILLSYYGWEDGRQHTLTEVGARFQITRERVRQVCAKLTRRRKDLATLPAPATDRALALVVRRLPCPAAEIEAELADRGLTAVGMRLESVAAAAKLLERSAAFRVVKIGVDGGRDGRLAVTPDDAERVPAVVDAARKEIYFHGVTTVNRVERALGEKRGGGASTDLITETLQMLDGFAWLDRRGGWFRLLNLGKHGLPKTIDKILAVAGETTIARMRAAIGRNRRLWKEPPPAEVLRAFCRGLPGVRVEGERVFADPPRNWKKALSGVEARLVAVLHEHGPLLERGEFEDLCVARGVNRFSFHAFVSWSPVIAQYGHSVYGLLGAETSAEQVRQVAVRRRARRRAHRVLDGHGRTDDGKVWLSYRLSKAASTYAVITIPSALKSQVRGRFTLLDADGRPVGTLATKDGRAWGLGAFLRRRGAKINDLILLTLDLRRRTAMVEWDRAASPKPQGAAKPQATAPSEI